MRRSPWNYVRDCAYFRGPTHAGRNIPCRPRRRGFVPLGSTPPELSAPGGKISRPRGPRGCGRHSSRPLARAEARCPNGVAALNAATPAQSLTIVALVRGEPGMGYSRRPPLTSVRPVAPKGDETGRPSRGVLLRFPDISGDARRDAAWDDLLAHADRAWTWRDRDSLVVLAVSLLRVAREVAPEWVDPEADVRRR